MRYIVLCLLLLTQIDFKANRYEKSLQDIAQEIALLVEKRGFEKVAIWNFQSINDQHNYISKPLTEDFSVHFTNATHSLKIYDRQHLESLTQELKMQQSGLMAPETAKEIGSFTGVEAIVIGNFALNKNKVKLWIKVIETESAFQIAMKNAILPWESKIYEKPKTSKLIHQKRPATAVNNYKGKLKLINKKASHLKVILKNGDFTKVVKVGSRSKIDVLDLPVGVYSCEVYFQSGDLFQKFDIKVKRNMTKYKIRAQSIFSLYI